MERRTLGSDRARCFAPRVRMRCRRRADGARQSLRPGASGRTGARARRSTISTPRRCMGMARSERNLGRVMKSLKPDIRGRHQGARSGRRTEPSRHGDRGLAGGEACSACSSTASTSSSCTITSPADGSDSGLTPETVLGEIVPALRAIAPAGQDPLLRHHGGRRHRQRFTRSSMRAPSTPHRVSYNLLNPSAGAAVPPGYPGA